MQAITAKVKVNAKQVTFVRVKKTNCAKEEDEKNGSQCVECS